MIIVISPSKTLDFSSGKLVKDHTFPFFLQESEKLIGYLREKSPPQLSELMEISDKLANLNAKRYRDFSIPFTIRNSRQAILAFKGDVYEGIDVDNYSKTDFSFAQEHLRIISGLYGLLKPLDLIQPYRLEMGTKLVTSKGKDLYEFWGDMITNALNSALCEQKSEFLINLASQEYFKSVHVPKLKGKIINISFKEKQGKALKTIGLFAKKARGRMTDFIIKNRITKHTDLINFSDNGYKFSDKLSDDVNYIFTRSAKANAR